VAGTLLSFGCLTAYAGPDRADIKIMTQNQYLGADLGPVIAATPAQYPFAIINALQSIAINNIPERIASLAEVDRRSTTASRGATGSLCIPMH